MCMTCEVTEDTHIIQPHAMRTLTFSAATVRQSIKLMHYRSCVYNEFNKTKIIDISLLVITF